MLNLQDRVYIRSTVYSEPSSQRSAAVGRARLRLRSGNRTHFTVHPRATQGTCSKKAARTMNPRCTNLTLYGINGDTGMRP
jgi:hypothetical protein